jgi:hypothetical protein
LKRTKEEKEMKQCISKILSVAVFAVAITSEFLRQWEQTVAMLGNQS